MDWTVDWAVDCGLGRGLWTGPWTVDWAVDCGLDYAHKDPPNSCKTTIILLEGRELTRNFG